MEVWFSDGLPAALLIVALVWHSLRLRKSENVEQLMAARRAWVRKVMGTRGHELLAVQTVRNSLMAASLMATTGRARRGGRAEHRQGGRPAGPRGFRGADGRHRALGGV